MSNTPATAEQAAEAIYKQLNSGTMYKEKVLDILEKGLEDFAKRNHQSKQVEQPSQVASQIEEATIDDAPINYSSEEALAWVSGFNSLRDRIKPNQD